MAITDLKRKDRMQIIAAGIEASVKSFGKEARNVWAGYYQEKTEGREPLIVFLAGVEGWAQRMQGAVNELWEPAEPDRDPSAVAEEATP
jgi:hypothetical protein